MAEPVARHVAGLEVFDHDIALGDQPFRQRLALGLRNVDGDGTLIAVGGQIVAALVSILAVLSLEIGRAPFARIVAGAGPLDLYDVGAEVAEQLGAGRAGQDAREIEDAQAGERAGPLWGGRCGHGHPVSGMRSTRLAREWLPQ